MQKKCIRVCCARGRADCELESPLDALGNLCKELYWSGPWLAMWFCYWMLCPVFLSMLLLSYSENYMGHISFTDGKKKKKKGKKFQEPQSPLHAALSCWQWSLRVKSLWDPSSAWSTWNFSALMNIPALCWNFLTSYPFVCNMRKPIIPWVSGQQ